MLGLATKKELEKFNADLLEVFYKQQQRISELEKKIEELHKKIDSLPKSVIDYADRLAEVEIKQAKLYTALIEHTPTGKEKLTKLGRSFGGKSRHLL